MQQARDTDTIAGRSATFGRRKPGELSDSDLETLRGGVTEFVGEAVFEG